mmetsp:Transcript_31210/g.48349  ORF Transcript_31210/g.48349 Transcript_31210/m.48349 type:complete len:96 (-) Transcript_31210:973-1260(-)
MDTRVSIQCYLMQRAGWSDPVEAQSNNLSKHQTEGVQLLMHETSRAHDTSMAMHDTSTAMHDSSGTSASTAEGALENNHCKTHRGRERVVQCQTR